MKLSRLKKTPPHRWKIQATTLAAISVMNWKLSTQSTCMKGKLTLTHRWLGDYLLQYQGDDNFDFRNRAGSLSFNRGPNGDVSGFTFDNDRTIGVEFRRFD